MHLSHRSYIIFVVGLLAATFGAGQMWSLALSLRGGSAGLAGLLPGALGLLLLMVGGLVLGRFLYLQAQGSRALRAREEEVCDDNRK